MTPLLSDGRSRAVIAVLACAAMVGSLQFTLMVPFIPDAPAVFGISTSDATWLIIVTLLTSTVCTPIITRMADLYGRKRIMLAALALLCIGSIIAAVGVSSFPVVIVGRILQGFASAVAPIGIGLLHSSVDRRRANVGVALLSGTVGMGSALGLPLSGILLSTVGLGGLFWVSAIASGVFIILIAIIVPESAERLERGFDFASAALLAIWLTALALVISKGAEWDWPGPASLGWTFGGAAAFVLWVVVSRRTPDAVIDLRLAVKPAMLRINIATFLATFGMFTNHLITMQEARSPLGSGIGLQLPISVAGLLLLPYALTMVLLTPVTGWFLNRFGAQNALWLGSLVMVFGFAFRTVVHANIAAVIVGVILCGAGAAFAFASMPALVSQAAPADEVASANGVNSLVRSLSGAIASSVIAFALVTAPSTVDPQFLSEQGFMVITGLVSLSSAFAVGVAIVHARRSAFLSG